MLVILFQNNINILNNDHNQRFIMFKGRVDLGYTLYLKGVHDSKKVNGSM